jgi:hypothetical protein
LQAEQTVSANDDYHDNKILLQASQECEKTSNTQFDKAIISEELMTVRKSGIT